MQYQYDLNGNVTTDSLNKNTSVVYDHRNLLTEIYHKKGTPPARIDFYATRYYYDDVGNRVRKLTYKNNNANAGPVLNWNNLTNPGNGWTLLNNEHYVRGVDGKELATYTNNTLDEWYVWGTDMVGKIKGSTKCFFFKDHLGSVRGVIDNNFNLVSAQDFDAWGYLMESRVYNSDSEKHKFTGKERHEENLYDYFGARYYDAKIGRWGGVDSLFSKHYDFTPYGYALNNPLRMIDPNGKQIESIYGDPMYYINKETMKIRQNVLGIEKEITRIQSNIEPAITIVLSYTTRVAVGQITGLNVPFVSVANPTILTIGGMVLGIMHQTPLPTSNQEEVTLRTYQTENDELLNKLKALEKNDTKVELEKNTKVNKDLDRARKHFLQKAKPYGPFQY